MWHRGDSLTLVLRGGDRIVLKTAREVTRGDIVKRHFLTHNNYYVTCRYTLSAYDIQRITRNRVTKLSSQTQGFTFDRHWISSRTGSVASSRPVYRYLRPN